MSLDSFMNKAYSVVNLLSLALGNETAAKRQIILSSDNEKFTIPVTPRSYEIKTAQNNETSMKFGGLKKIYYLCTRKKNKIMNGLYTILLLVPEQVPLPA